MAATLDEQTGNLWRDVRHDIARNPSALTGFFLLLSLLLFCTFGKLLWPDDPAALDLTQISQPPHLGLQTLVIYPDDASPVIAPENIHALQLTAPAHTEAVRLAWPTKNTMNFTLYRHTLPPSGLQDLGLPLATVHVDSTVSTVNYIDQLLLENRRYFYSVVSLDHAGKPIGVETLAVDVAHATPAENLNRHDGEHPKTIQLPAHPFGTDKLGRDLLARLIEGGRTSLFIGFAAPMLYVLFGALYGAMAGYRGGRIDTGMMAFADFVIALPFLLFVILLRIAFGLGAGDSGITALLVALLLLSWPNSARLVRAQVLQLRSMAYVDAARLQGASGFYIVWKHMLPNVLPSILVTLSFAIPAAIFTEAFLSFIGLGVVPPASSWGSMCNEGLSTLLTHPHELLFPATFISLTVLAFNLFGDGLRDALDVQTREARQ
ncbi:MAG TPA: ABC transporter permease [Pseudomonadales bacterium]|nr:ABC transporter permease [Pseudomonadales bacterium]